MNKTKIAVVLCLFLSIPALSHAASNFEEDFTITKTAGCQADGTKFGSWEVRYASYGCVNIQGTGSDSAMVISPKVSTSAAETHAPLVLGPSVTGDLDFTLRMKTDSQLRKNSTPNAWEVGWVLWDYTDDTHFYSLVLKPNGWELGKEDPAYGGAQRFLATGSSPAFPIGQWYTVRITRDASSHIKAYVNGTLLTEFIDTERPYLSGRIALYNEDAITRFDDIRVGKLELSVPAAPLPQVAVPMVVPFKSIPVVAVAAARIAPKITGVKKAKHHWRHFLYLGKKLDQKVAVQTR